MKNEDIKILLIEDDPFLSSMYDTKFKLEHFEVMIAPDGAEGLELAKSKNPSIILLDIMLPKVNGFDVLRELKANAKTKNIPVILLSNLSQKDEVDEGLELGAEEFVIKAYVTPTEMVNKIKNRFNLA